MKDKREILEVPLALIEPDPDQPRKNFDAKKLGELMASIKKHGVLQPLVVEKRRGGKYLLEDGERRFRALTELGIKTAPVIVTEEKDDVDRLIHQFHLQEQHQEWSALEKAVAANKLSEKLNLTIAQLAELLNLDKRTVQDYVAFGKLHSKKEYQKQEIPVAYLTTIISTREAVKKTYEEAFEEEFDVEDQKGLELAIIRGFKNGSIQKSRDIIKIKDAARSDPKIIKKFIADEKKTATSIFLETKARDAYYARNIFYMARAIRSYANSGNTKKMAEMYSDNQKAEFENAIKYLKEIISYMK